MLAQGKDQNMTDQIPLIESKGQEIPDPAIPPLDLWLIVGWWRTRGWRIPPNTKARSTKEDAIAQVPILQDNGWRQLKLLHITEGTSTP